MTLVNNGNVGLVNVAVSVQGSQGRFPAACEFAVLEPGATSSLCTVSVPTTVSDFEHSKVDFTAAADSASRAADRAALLKSQPHSVTLTQSRLLEVTAVPLQHTVVSAGE